MPTGLKIAEMHLANQAKHGVIITASVTSDAAGDRVKRETETSVFKHHQKVQFKTSVVSSFADASPDNAALVEEHKATVASYNELKHVEVGDNTSFIISANNHKPNNRAKLYDSVKRIKEIIYSNPNVLSFSGDCYELFAVFSDQSILSNEKTWINIFYTPPEKIKWSQNSLLLEKDAEIIRLFCATHDEGLRKFYKEASKTCKELSNCPYDRAYTSLLDTHQRIHKKRSIELITEKSKLFFYGLLMLALVTYAKLDQWGILATECLLACVIAFINIRQHLQDNESDLAKRIDTIMAERDNVSQYFLQRIMYPYLHSISAAHSFCIEKDSLWGRDYLSEPVFSAVSIKLAERYFTHFSLREANAPIKYLDPLMLAIDHAKENFYKKLTVGLCEDFLVPILKAIGKSDDDIDVFIIELIDNIISSTADRFKELKSKISSSAPTDKSPVQQLPLLLQVIFTYQQTALLKSFKDNKAYDKSILTMKKFMFYYVQVVLLAKMTPYKSLIHKSCKEKYDEMLIVLDNICRTAQYGGLNVDHGASLPAIIQQELISQACSTSLPVLMRFTRTIGNTCVFMQVPNADVGNEIKGSQKSWQSELAAFKKECPNAAHLVINDKGDRDFRILEFYNCQFPIEDGCNPYFDMLVFMSKSAVFKNSYKRELEVLHATTNEHPAFADHIPATVKKDMGIHVSVSQQPSALFADSALRQRGNSVASDIGSKNTASDADKQGIGCVLQ